MVLRRNERLKTGGIPGLAVAANPSGGTSFPFEFTQAVPYYTQVADSGNKSSSSPTGRHSRRRSPPTAAR